MWMLRGSNNGQTIMNTNSAYTNLMNPRMQKVLFPTMLDSQKRNMHISVLNKALWDMEQAYPVIRELGQLEHWFRNCSQC